MASFFDKILNEFKPYTNLIYICLHKHNESEEDNYGQMYFNKFGSFHIDRYVEFFKIENLFYILDRERI